MESMSSDLLTLLLLSTEPIEEAAECFAFFVPGHLGPLIPLMSNETLRFVARKLDGLLVDPGNARFECDTVSDDEKLLTIYKSAAQRELLSRQEKLASTIQDEEMDGNRDRINSIASLFDDLNDENVGDEEEEDEDGENERRRRDSLVALSVFDQHLRENPSLRFAREGALGLSESIVVRSVFTTTPNTGVTSTKDGGLLTAKVRPKTAGVTSITASRRAQEVTEFYLTCLIQLAYNEMHSKMGLSGHSSSYWTDGSQTIKALLHAMKVHYGWYRLEYILHLVIGRHLYIVPALFDSGVSKSIKLCWHMAMLEYAMNSLMQLSKKEACAVALECLSQVLIEHSCINGKAEELAEVASFFVPVLAFVSSILKTDIACGDLIHEWIMERIYLPSTNQSIDDSAVDEEKTKFTRSLSLALFSRHPSNDHVTTLKMMDATILEVSSALGHVAANAVNRQMQLAIESLELKPEIALPLGLIFMSEYGNGILLN
jgi:hypothetical protein